MPASSHVGVLVLAIRAARDGSTVWRVSAAAAVGGGLVPNDTHGRVQHVFLAVCVTGITQHQGAVYAEGNDNTKEEQRECHAHA